MHPRYRRGDRVRIINPHHEYTGCRGTISDDSSEPPEAVAQLGHHVAIDGENGLSRPFLATDLEPLRALQAGRRSLVGKRSSREAQPAGD